MAKAEREIVGGWLNVNTDTLKTDQREAYDMLRLAMDEVKQAKAKFEALMVKGYPAPAGEELVFSYRFGLGIATAKVQPAKAKPVAMSLTAYLAARR